MKNNLLLLSGLMIFALFTEAQNKTFGIGVPTPNPNAVLHVESPTNNQGFILPRITTAQRNAMSASLTANENGLLVYDSDLKTIFIWNTSFWSLPYKTKFLITDPNSPDTALTAKTYSNQFHGFAISGIQKGTGDAAGFFLVDNPSSTFPAIVGENRGKGTGGSFVIHNAASNNAALYGETNGTGGAAIAGLQLGTGSAGYFNTNNSANTFAALYTTTSGTAAALLSETSTGYAAIQGRQSNASGIQNAIDGLHDGAGQGHAGLFQLTNVANNYPAIQAETAGTGPGLRVLQSTTSLGGGIDISLQNPTASTTGVNVGQLGTGPAGNFTINNASNSQSAIYATTNGTGSAAGFTINNPSSSANGMYSIANTTGAAIFAEVTNGGYAAIDAKNSGTTGNAVLSHIENATSNSSALVATTIGTGPAASFQINNASNSSTTLNSTTNGTGSAGYLAITNAANNTPALFVTTNGSGASIIGNSTGSVNSIAGLFMTTNSANNYPAVQAVVAGNGANGIYVNHQGTGGNLIVLTNNDVAAARIDKTGKGFFNSGTQNNGADVAEMFDVEGTRQSYEPGDVLVISEDTDRTVEKSSEPNSTRVAGVYATKPGVTLTEKGMDENLDQLVPMGVIGVIPTKVCSENGAIRRGDLLVTSSIRGHAMKAIPDMVNGISIYPTGAVLGKALENFNGTGTGLIKVLVNVK